jgi:ABC-type multidrug transport system ATPase subunit
MIQRIPALEVRELTKRYGPPESGLVAVDHISFQVQQGEVFGFLGPNGAGKTTTIRLLAGLSEPTAGQAQLMGLDRSQHLPQIKKRIGVVPEASNLYDELTAFDNLVFSMQLYGVPRHERAPRAEELLARFRLADKRDTPFAKLSRGMKRALTIAAALAHRPALLFLDEPTTGLDVLSARSLRQMIAGLRDEGVTVFLTTHYLEEAERLCDRIALLVRGKIVALDTLASLKAGCGTGHFTRWFEELGLQTAGIDLSLPMLAEAIHLGSLPYVHSDALALPFSSGAFDLVALITTLEFVADPVQALGEVLRVCRQGLLLGALNRQSLLGWQRKKEGGQLWDATRFFAPAELSHLVRRAAAGRRIEIFRRTTLWPIWPGALPLPWGGFIGMAVMLS